MNPKSKKSNKKVRIVVISLSLVLLIGTAVGLIFQDKIKSAASGISATIENQGRPKFVFDTVKYPDWATAGNTYNPDDIINDGPANGEDVLVSALSVIQCDIGSSCSKLFNECQPYAEDKPACKQLAQKTADTNCLVMALYSERKVDAAQEVTSYIERTKSYGSLDIEETGTRNLTMNTPDGLKEYALHYYDYKLKGGGTIKHGNAIGYVSLANGNIGIRSICSETDQLDETVPILSGIRLEV